MARIAVVIDDAFDAGVYREAAPAFKSARHEIVHVGLKKGLRVQGHRSEFSVRIDEEIAGLDQKSIAALLIPGGHSLERLANDGQTMTLLEGFFRTNKAVFAIGSGLTLLAKARVLAGRKVTGPEKIIPEIRRSGGCYLDREVVIDRGLITGKNPKRLSLFIQASLAKLVLSSVRPWL